MYYIIFDTEYITGYKADTRPPDLVNIGAVCIDSKGNKIDTFNNFIKPKYRKNGNKFFTELTGITTNQLLGGYNLKASLHTFERWTWKYKPHVLCCWSNSDILMFHESCKISYIQTLVNYHKYFDIQYSYMDLFRIRQQPSLKSVLLKNNLITEDELESISFHNALTDAEYTTKLFLKYSSDFKSDINDDLSGALLRNAFDLSSVR